MSLPSQSRVYDTIGHRYARNRVPDPRIASQILRALGAANSVCNIGAGAGSYEPGDRHVVAVEPSELMIAQRSDHPTVVRAVAESLPFDDQQFDAAMTVLSIHHWADPRQGIQEMKRVSRRQVVLTFDPEQTSRLWLVRDYLPEIAEFENQRAVPIDRLKSWLETDRVETVLIPHDCTDGFQAAYWRRPAEYLKLDIQASISTLAQLPPNIVASALHRLERDLKTGDWEKRYAELCEATERDFGYRLLIAGHDFAG